MTPAQEHRKMRPDILAQICNDLLCMGWYSIGQCTTVGLGMQLTLIAFLCYIHFDFLHQVAQ